MVINPDRQLSWAFADPSKSVASAVQAVQGAQSSRQLFHSLFDGTAGASTGPAKRPAVVDKVLASYKSLREGNTRLSSADKLRLDTHMAMLAELQGSLNAHVACVVPPTPIDDAEMHGGRRGTDAVVEMQLWADVVAAGFACGASRVAVYGYGGTERLSDYPGSDWHQEVAHQWFADQPQKWLAQSYRGVFEKLFVYLAAKLDALDDGDGKTVLDNTLMGWSQECCMSTHDSFSIPVVTFGGAAGRVKTGRYIDYRKTNETAFRINDTLPAQTSLGVLYGQFLANAMQSMGLTPAEYELWSGANGGHGYGTPFVATESWGPPYRSHYTATDSVYFQRASDPLPFFMA
jgi:hypothetical protein